MSFISPKTQCFIPFFDNPSILAQMPIQIHIPKTISQFQQSSNTPQIPKLDCILHKFPDGPFNSHPSEPNWKYISSNGSLSSVQSRWVPGLPFSNNLLIFSPPKRPDEYFLSVTFQNGSLCIYRVQVLSTLNPESVNHPPGHNFRLVNLFHPGNLIELDNLIEISAQKKIISGIGNSSSTHNSDCLLLRHIRPTVGDYVDSHLSVSHIELFTVSPDNTLLTFATHDFLYIFTWFEYGSIKNYVFVGRLRLISVPKSISIALSHFPTTRTGSNYLTRSKNIIKYDYRIVCACSTGLELHFVSCTHTLDPVNNLFFLSLTKQQQYSAAMGRGVQNVIFSPSGDFLSFTSFHALGIMWAFPFHSNNENSTPFWGPPLLDPRIDPILTVKIGPSGPEFSSEYPTMVINKSKAINPVSLAKSVSHPYFFSHVVNPNLILTSLLFSPDEKSLIVVDKSNTLLLFTNSSFNLFIADISTSPKTSSVSRAPQIHNWKYTSSRPLLQKQENEFIPHQLSHWLSAEYFIVSCGRKMMILSVKTGEINQVFEIQKKQNQIPENMLSKSTSNNQGVCFMQDEIKESVQGLGILRNFKGHTQKEEMLLLWVNASGIGVLDMSSK